MFSWLIFFRFPFVGFKASKEKVKEREELIERPGQSHSQSQSQIECKVNI